MFILCKAVNVFTFVATSITLWLNGNVIECNLRKKQRMRYHKNVRFLKPEEFENVAFFLRLDLPSTLIRHENEALFLRLGLPSTLIRYENRQLLIIV